MPRKIAEFLQLDDPDGYTGRSYRATSTKLTDTGLSNDTTNRTNTNNRNPVDDKSNILNKLELLISLTWYFTDAADYTFNDTNDVRQLITEEDEVCILDSSSEDDEDVIMYVRHNSSVDIQLKQ